MISKPRQGLDALLAKYPEADAARIISQRGDIQKAVIEKVHPHPEHTEYFLAPGPWLLADLYVDGRIELFAIWNETGNVYRLDEQGAVEDDPFIVITKGG